MTHRLCDRVNLRGQRYGILCLMTERSLCLHQLCSRETLLNHRNVLENYMELGFLLPSKKPEFMGPIQQPLNTIGNENNSEFDFKLCSLAKVKKNNFISICSDQCSALNHQFEC